MPAGESRIVDRALGKIDDKGNRILPKPPERGRVDVKVSTPKKDSSTEIAASVLMGKDAKGLSPVEKQAVVLLTGATAETAHKNTLESRKLLTQVENKVSRDTIDTVVGSLSPERRNDVEAQLVTIKKYTEVGDVTADLDNKLTTSVARQAIQYPEIKALYRGKTREEQDRFDKDVVNNPEYRRIVQRRQKELVAEHQSGLSTLRSTVEAAQGRVAQLQDHGEDLNQQRFDEEESIKKLKEKQFNNATEIAKYNREVETQENSNPGKKKRYEDQQSKVNSLKADINKLKDENQSTTRKDAELRQEEAKLHKDFPDHVKLAELKQQGQQIDLDIQESQNIFSSIEGEIAQNREQMEQAKQQLDQAQQRYESRQKEFTDELDSLFDRAASEYFDTKIATYIDQFIASKDTISQDIYDQVRQDLYKQLHERWFIKWFKLRRGMAKYKIGEDFSTLMKFGPEGFLQQYGITDPDVVKKLGPEVAKDILRLTNDTGRMNRRVARELQTMPWAKDIMKQFEDDPKFRDSLADYQRGNMQNTLWLVMMLGGSLGAVIAKNAEHTDDRNTENEE